MKKIIHNTDYQRLINACVGIKDPKCIAITLIAFTGSRSNEVLRITHKSFNITTHNGSVGVAIKLTASKRGQDREIELPAELNDSMIWIYEGLKSTNKTLAAMIGTDSWQIRSAYALLRTYFNNLQIELLGEQRHTLHAFRHSLAVRGIKAGLNIMEIKAMLGHGNINSTFHYLAEYERSLVLNKVHTLVRGS